jgi:FAD/FMN-containing dehydrogenase
MLNPATPDFEVRLRGLLPAAAFGREPQSYLSEPRGRWTGQGVVVAPGSVEEVATLVRACHDARVGIVPYSGGTGLVGGQLLADGPVPVVLALDRLTRIREVFPSENVLIAEAGAILADVQAAAREVDRLFPLSLASEGSARIGGLLATNAGGVNVLRYGNARAQCLGLEVVTADGQVWHGLTRLRKDNTGYDLRDLMIGSEGTLGIITAAALRLSPQPPEIGVAMLAVASPEAALALLAQAQAQMGDGITAFELIHRQGPDFLSEVGPEVRMPFSPMPDWCVLIEVGLAEGMVPDEALGRLYATASDAGLVSDGVIAQSVADRAALWAVREAIPQANRRIGAVSSHDISLPLSRIPEFIETAPAHVAKIDAFRINCFGHLGDGNLHWNVFPVEGRSRDDHDHQRGAVKRAVHDLVHQMGGSVSAEHGIGRLKVEDLERYGDPAKLAMMRAVKTALDPRGILNPGAVLRLPAES